MLIIINKKPNSNQWDYPDDIKLFTDGFLNPSDNSQLVVTNKTGKTAVELSAAEYSGVAPVNYRTRITNGELIFLMEKLAFSKVFRAAYPQGNKPEDDEALYFFERGKYPIDSDGLIDVTSSTMTAALDYFIVSNYMTAADKTRIQQGMPINN